MESLTNLLDFPLNFFRQKIESYEYKD